MAVHDTPTITSDLSLLSETDLTSATNRAWRESARCFADYRREPSTSPVNRMLLTSAEAAEEWFETLRDEQQARLGGTPDEVRSSDVYEVQPDTFPLPDRGVATLPQPMKSADVAPVVPVISPWVARAAEGRSGSKSRGAVSGQVTK